MAIKCNKCNNKNYLRIQNFYRPSRVVYAYESVTNMGTIFDQYIGTGEFSYTGTINGPVGKIANNFPATYACKLHEQFHIKMFNMFYKKITITFE